MQTPVDAQGVPDVLLKRNESMAIPPENRKDIAIPLGEPCGASTPQLKFNGNNWLPFQRRSCRRRASEALPHSLYSS